ncbi:hypothetical protein VTK56DRAFT_2154 [Thermocarpiscus australiensis]
MFGSRRHRTPHPSLTPATADPNAATAAAVVFKRHETNPSLSAAAAAAALRARPMTPTRVADVQTKRTLRRSASVASTPTASDIPREHGLSRRGSSGSMTERTFRTPSPHRPGSKGSAHRPSQSVAYDMPPVPALPKNMDAAQDSQQRNANSLGMVTTPLRLGSQRLGPEDAPSWFSAAKLGDPGNVRRTDPAMASPPSSPLQIPVREDEPAEAARPSSQASSINFSYPARIRVASPSVVQTHGADTSVRPPTGSSPPHPSVEHGRTMQASEMKQPSRGQVAAPPSRTRSASNPPDRTLIYDPNSRRMVRQADLLALQQAVLDASQQPTAPKKKKKRTPQRTGSHLAAGTIDRTKAQIGPPAPVNAPAAQPHADIEELPVKATINSPRIEAKKVEQQRFQEPAVEVVKTIAPVAPSPIPAAAEAVPPAIREQPLMVEEEPEAKNLEPEIQTQKAISDALDAVPGRRRMHARKDPDTNARVPLPPKEVTPSSDYLVGQTSPSTDEQPMATAGRSHSVDVSKDEGPKPGITEHGRTAAVSHDRTHSSSPARQAHFGPVQSSLMVRHSPPPRSISPLKSAMKHTSPTRGASPSGDMFEASGSVNQEPPVARRKSVRVSFDDDDTAVAQDRASTSQDNSQLPADPQNANRRRWLSNPGRNREELASLEDDEVMKPRPALPSFGSIRARVPRDTSPRQSERPLVRPKGETRYASPPLGPSNDHAIGLVLSNEHEDRSRHEANTSRPREPLPPIVTSVEGTGYSSDSSSPSSSISSGSDKPGTSLPHTAQERQAEATVEHEHVLPKPPANGWAADSVSQPSIQVTKGRDLPPEPQAPVISIPRPTPALAENKPLERSSVNIPGGFPEDDSDQSAASDAKRTAQATTVSSTAVARPRGDQPESPTAPAARPAMEEEGSSDSESSIYSDAYEDFSGVEGGGFQSLDAVVESPIQGSRQSAALDRRRSERASVQTPSEPAPKLQMEISSATTAVATPPLESPADEWQRLKAYWRSLTPDQRAELEREAREEANIKADMEAVKPEAKLKERSIERTDSERKASDVRIAQQMTAQHGKGKASHPERTYMIEPGARWTGGDTAFSSMRKTMRDDSHQRAAVASAEGPRLRRSMRTSDSSTSSPEHLRAEDRAASSRGISTPPTAVAAPEVAGHRRSVTQIDFQVEPVAGVIQRRGSTGSETSFKRFRSGPRAQGSGFRQSLRPTSVTIAQGDAPPSRRFSLRALSPTGSSSKQGADVPRVSLTGHPQMRTTLRRSPTEGKSSSGIRFPGFGRLFGGKKIGARAQGTKASGSRFSSRFAESSDEDDDNVAAGFRSRFEDSSDEESVLPVPVPLSKSSSAPSATPPSRLSVRRRGSIASTPLPEELEEPEESQEPNAMDRQATVTEDKATAAQLPFATDTTPLRSGQLPPGPQNAPALGTAAISSAAAAAGTAATTTTAFPGASGGSRRGSRRRNSIMSVLRRKRHGGGGGSGSGSGSAGRIARPEISESAARRDTRLERSVDQLRGIRSAAAGVVDDDDDGGGEDNDGNGEGKAPRRDPLLQRRVAALRAVPEMTPAVAGVGVAGGDISLEGTGPGEGGGGGFNAAVRRASTSENLGTRTLSGGGAGVGALQQRRVMSMGGVSFDWEAAGSTAGTSSTRKKRFGKLRRMFRLDD